MAKPLLTNQERSMLERAFHRAEESLAAELTAKGVTDPEARKVMIAQNLLRGCMECVFHECLPYGRVFLMEIAGRLAAYAITAAPHKDVEAITGIVAFNLHQYVKMKISQGNIIKTHWEIDEEEPGAPKGTMN